jgi:hypothetical protein
VEKLNDLQSVRQYVSFFESLDQVQACALGGSKVEGHADAQSDVDLFLFLSGENFLEFVSGFGRLFADHLDTIAYRYRGYLLDMGYQYSTVHPGPVFLDIFLNCAATLTHTPLLSLNRVIFDKTGRYTELIAESQHHSGLEEAVGEFLIELDLLAKFARRREIFPFLARLDRLRSIAIGLQRAKRGLKYNSYLADRQIGPVIGVGYETWLMTQTVPAISGNLAGPVDALIKDASASMEVLELPSRTDPRAFEYAERLRSEIIMLCRGWNPTP